LSVTAYTGTYYCSPSHVAQRLVNNSLKRYYLRKHLAISSKCTVL